MSIANSTALSAVPEPSVPTATVSTIGGAYAATRRRVQVASEPMAIDEHEDFADISVAPVVGPGRPAPVHRLGHRGPAALHRRRRRRRAGRAARRARRVPVHARRRIARCTAGSFWTMRQYAGYASAKESNQRYKYLLAHGSTGLSMAFDLPTQLGLDSDDPRCLGEVGRTGVAIDTLDDMRTAFDGIPLDEVSTSMTINAPPRCCCCSTSSSARSRAWRPRSCAARSRTTSSRSTSRAGTSSTRPCRRCA